MLQTITYYMSNKPRNTRIRAFYFKFSFATLPEKILHKVCLFVFKFEKPIIGKLIDSESQKLWITVSNKVCYILFEVFPKTQILHISNRSFLKLCCLFSPVSLHFLNVS